MLASNLGRQVGRWLEFAGLGPTQPADIVEKEQKDYEQQNSRIAERAKRRILALLDGIISLDVQPRTIAPSFASSRKTIAMSPQRPAVFIGSSAEGKEVAKAIQLELDHSCEATIWHQAGIKGFLDSVAVLSNHWL